MHATASIMLSAPRSARLQLARCSTAGHRPAAAAARRCRHRQHLGRVQAAGDEPSSAPAPESPGGSPGGAGAGAGGGSMEGSVDITSRAVSLPMGLPTAGAVFVMAGFLKLLIMCFPYSEMAIMMFIQGRADLGLWGALKAIPLALGLAAAAKAIVDRQLHKRRWAQPAIMAAGAVLLVLSRLVFSRPKPSVLDPYFRQLNQERAAAAAEQRRAAVAQQQRKEQHLLPQPDARVGAKLQQKQERGRP